MRQTVVDVTSDEADHWIAHAADWSNDCGDVASPATVPRLARRPRRGLLAHSQVTQGAVESPGDGVSECSRLFFLRCTSDAMATYAKAVVPDASRRDEPTPLSSRDRTPHGTPTKQAALGPSDQQSSVQVRMTSPPVNLTALRVGLR